MERSDKGRPRAWTVKDGHSWDSCSIYLINFFIFKNLIIPEQFKVKAHPALFGGEGQKNEEHFYSSLQLTYTFKSHSKMQKTPENA